MTTSSVLNCGPLTISADFDSGNVLKAELIYAVNQLDPKSVILSPSSSLTLATYQFENQDYELNVWTRPDCYGTSFENGNRTWFHFGINGGKSYGVIKLNIINLNKQTKLFSQGMQPVFRILPSKSKWERIEDRVIINENKPQENGCSISFRIRLPENTTKSTLYVAFTYPFGYLELSNVLRHLDNELLKKITKAGPKQPKINRRDLSLHLSDSEIYYHRECICYSLEGRRIELLTVTSINGISDKREDRLANLFPILEEPRPFKFPGKKVVFLSARVHPGETQSSFVLHGFLKFVIHKTDPRAVILRRFFVFKFIPILNPDGVFNGHYRTDPRGVNLNRVYLSPSPQLHPSIYAARKLLIYYHSGIDLPDEFEENTTPVNDCTSSSIDSNNKSVGAIPSCSKSKSPSTCISLFSEDTCFDPLPGPAEHGGILNPHSQACQQASTSKKPYTFVLSDANSICAGCVPLDDAVPCSEGNLSMSGAGSLLGNLCDSLNESLGSSHQCAFEACDEDSVYYENLKLNDPVNSNNMEIDHQCEPQSKCDTDSQASSAGSRPSSSRSGRRKKQASPVKDKKKPRASSASESTSKRLGSSGPGNGNMKWSFNAKTARTTRSQKSGFKSTSSSRYFDPSSGIFLYVDMHGHTTKRGIFMYGNHFSDVNTQAECMLVPRLMAMNSPHFDFAACNFTERLMCCKDKKDGLSREGSGRVACLKLTGLVRSYTLECNYNTGRVVNPIVPRPAAAGFVDDLALNVFQPPKYTVEIYEQVGKSLAETVLDISGQNPFSRLNTTEFKTVEGVKRSLVSRLKLSPEFKTSTPNIMTETLFKIEPPSSADGNANPVVKTGSAGSKINKKSRSKLSIPLQAGGPLGPKNRENQNSQENAKPKPSGSQTKKLPQKQLSLLSEDAAIVGTSSSSSHNKSPNKSTSLTKSKLAKVMKSKNFPKFSAAKPKSRNKKSDKSDKL